MINCDIIYKIKPDFSKFSGDFVDFSGNFGDSSDFSKSSDPTFRSPSDSDVP